LNNGDFLDDNCVQILVVSTRCVKDYNFVQKHLELENLSTGIGYDEFIRGLDFSYTPNLRSFSANGSSSYKNFEN
jgi:hypothetical protein